MSFAKLYTTVLIAGIIGAIAGAFAGGSSPPTAAMADWSVWAPLS